MYENIPETIGNTPLVRLRRVLGDCHVRLFGKLEGFNPGGSAKDRPAFAMIRSALAEGRIDRDTVVVESSSGNMGIALAMACAYYGLRFICVVDPRTNGQTIRILETYGAEIELVLQPCAKTKEFLPERLRRVKSLVDSRENAYWPNQYQNPANPRAHYETTMAEIDRDLDGKMDYLFCAVSTCGTIRGCAEYIRDHNLPTKLIAVDAVGSKIFGFEEGYHRIPGMGAGIQPPFCPHSMIEHYIKVSDVECIVGCRQLLRKEAILAGGSSGGMIIAVERYMNEMMEGATCVAILHDRGDRYLDTVYSDEWVENMYGREWCGELEGLAAHHR
jgi:2,3-diaminopropionate biosynthesis protein SbnA